MTGKKGRLNIAQRRIVVFIEPKGSKKNVFDKFMSLPLMGPIYLATILKRRGHKVKVLNENLLRREVNCSDLDADILCLSLITASANRGFEIARQYRLQNPHGKIIIGGIHPSMLPDEAKTFADYVVIGEGESVIIDLVEGKIRDKIVRAEHIKLDDYPLPDYSVLERNERMSIKPIITSRGCPFDCNFCSVTEMFGKKYRTVSINNTLKILRKLQPKKVFFYDDNFAALKKRTYDMVKRFKRSDLDFRWTCQVRTDVTNDPKLVEKMADAGCYNVYVGFESVNPKTLKGFNKAQGIKNIKNSIRVFHDNGIKIHGMFIFGSDNDDKRVFQRTADFCNHYGIDSTQFAILCPLPGTKVFRDFDQQGRLLHKIWDYYDALHTVYKPKNMTPLELQEGMVDAFHDFYSYTRAANDALNIFVEYNVNAVKSIYSHVTLPSFSRVGFRMMGAKIVSSWVKQNQDYLNFLSKFEIKKRAMSYASGI